MDSTERAMLIRRANELFNARDYKNSLKIYLATAYKDGIGRIASIMEHEKRDKVTALKLYKKAGLYGNVEKLAWDMAQAVRKMLDEDRASEAQHKGQNYNSSSKISGQAPEILPSEALRIAKKKLGINDPELSLAERENRIQRWNPIVINRDQLDNKRRKS